MSRYTYARLAKRVKTEVGTIRRANEKALAKKYREFYKPASYSNSVARHRHKYPETPGWVSVYNGIRTGHYSCTFPNCLKDIEK